MDWPEWRSNKEEIRHMYIKTYKIDIYSLYIDSYLALYMFIK